ncbi:hypothetical protein [Mycoplasma yeatsii]|uniref:hypothetical protein n=1 Tax=Mycoplasma yeatsii TaxID=51365 RepID=UPI0003A942B1|nr:hypothetical protein [Mycoplasma yeatsii]
MKKSKLIVLTSLLIPTTISIPAIVNFNFSKKHSHSINNQSNNTNANELINSLNESIKVLREKITQIDSQITALEEQKDKKRSRINSCYKRTNRFRNTISTNSKR